MVPPKPPVGIVNAKHETCKNGCVAVMKFARTIVPLIVEIFPSDVTFPVNAAD